MNTYRVWMKDGYACLHNAETEQLARQQAIELAKADIEGAAISLREKCLAIKVDYVEQIGGSSG